MSNAEKPKIPVGTIKVGQYMAESSHLTRTPQKPTAPGLFGYHKSRDAKAYVVDAELKNGTLIVDNKNADRCRGPVANIEGEWAGPSLPPK